MTSPATMFQDPVAVAARALEVPDAEFDNGMNLGGSCAPGIGINMLEGSVVGTPEQFTLLDQQGNARTPQIGQSIGGLPYVNRAVVLQPSSGGTEGTEPNETIQFGDAPTQAAKDADPHLDGTLIVTGESALVDLAAGWVANIP